MKSAAATAFWVCLPLLLLILAFAAWNPPGNFWGSVEPPKAQCEAYNPDRLTSATRLTADIYDSGKLHRMIREPQNTVSNLAYVFIGFAILFAGRRLLSRSLGVACIFLGVGSGLYHASLLPEWRLADILGVYTVLFGFLVLGGCAAFRFVGRRLEFVAAVAPWLFGVLAGIHRNDVRIVGIKLFDSTYVVVAAVALISICVLLCWRHAHRSAHYFRSLIVLGLSAPLAFFGGIADRFGGLLARPDALIQGHTIWHTLGAVALLAAYESFAATGFDQSVFAPEAISNLTHISQNRSG